MKSAKVLVGVVAAVGVAFVGWTGVDVLAMSNEPFEVYSPWIDENIFRLRASLLVAVGLVIGGVAICVVKLFRSRARQTAATGVAGGAMALMVAVAVGTTLPEHVAATPATCSVSSMTTPQMGPWSCPVLVDGKSAGES